VSNIELAVPRPEDAEALAAAVLESLPELIPWMEWASDAYTVDSARQWIADQPAKFESRTAFEFFIKDASGALLGVCGINRISAPPQRFANLGYWVRSSATGKGIAPAAVRRLAEWAFRETDLIRQEIVVAVGNERSRRVAEKAGGTFEGTLRSRLWIHGPQDAHMYSLVRLET
jgi:ribosomal-protein-serine acetyltransferase